MQHLGDITQIDGTTIPPVDVITFGSPCTRLSVAGRHDGFSITFTCKEPGKPPHWQHSITASDKYRFIYSATCPECGKQHHQSNESALFFHAVRIIAEMRQATNGMYPTFAVWEQVPGAFSSNKGSDFHTALEQLCQAAGYKNTLVMPANGKWLKSGTILADGFSIAWRVLDAQFWGVPQRRRRIALVVDFGGKRAPQILFEQESLRGYPAQGEEPGQATATHAAHSLGAAGKGSGSVVPFPQVARTLTARHDGSYNPARNSGQNIVCFPSTALHLTQDPISSTESTPCLSSGNSKSGQASLGVVIPFDTTQITSPQNGSQPKPGAPSHPLCAKAHPPALIEASAFLTGQSAQARGIGYQQEVSPTLKGEVGGNTVPAVHTTRAVASNNTVPFPATYQQATGPLMANSHPGSYTGQDAHSDMLVTVPVYCRGSTSANAGTSEDIAQTLTSRVDPAIIALPNLRPRTKLIPPELDYLKTKLYDARGNGSGEVSTTLTGNHQRTISDYTAIALEAHSVDCRNHTENTELYPTLQAKQNGGQSLNYTPPVRVGYSVRRLTPLECERLQGYPDHWTDIQFFDDGTGKLRKASESARYKALGNSIALPPWRFVLGSLSRFLPKNATLGSLFDGIGGFPKVWEEIHGPGSAVWASEIDPFAIAVTKHHFKEAA